MKYDILPRRQAGILLHPTSLPGPEAIGTLGIEAYEFIEELQRAGQSLWQVCPLGPTGYGDSPYQCFSAYAGNPFLIDLRTLASHGLLEETDLTPLLELPQDHVDFGAMIPLKRSLLAKAGKKFRTSPPSSGPYGPGPYQAFLEKESLWLDTYCAFTTLKDLNGGVAWNQWKAQDRDFYPELVEKVRTEHSEKYAQVAFEQFAFFTQWEGVKKAANDRGIQVIGDMPIFIAFDSADCWADRNYFQIDDQGNPTAVAGVPPDYFSPTGQLWGNPLYKWDALEADGFRWWIDILKNKLAMYDYIRIDHFRGFCAYWSVPFGDTTAENGQWIPAPAHKLFNAVKGELPQAPIIAENLGVITEDVDATMDHFGFPGMKVLQFGFDSAEENDHSPHNAVPNSLVYTGTHDNDTSRGWLATANQGDAQVALDYLGATHDTFHWDMIRSAYASVGRFAIVPLQDVLGLGSEGRMNLPGRLGGNWHWRYGQGQLSDELIGRLARYTQIFGRK